jgi:hypothetical protein
MAARRPSASATTTHLESPALPRSATGGEGHLRRRAGAYREGSFRGLPDQMGTLGTQQDQITVG